MALENLTEFKFKINESLDFLSGVAGSEKTKFNETMKFRAVELINTLPNGTELTHVTETFPLMPTVTKIVVTRYPADRDRIHIDKTVKQINLLFKVTNKAIK